MHIFCLMIWCFYDWVSDKRDRGKTALAVPSYTLITLFRCGARWRPLARPPSLADPGKKLSRSWCSQRTPATDTSSPPGPLAATAAPASYLQPCCFRRPCLTRSLVEMRVCSCSRSRGRDCARLRYHRTSHRASWALARPSTCARTALCCWHRSGRPPCASALCRDPIELAEAESRIGRGCFEKLQICSSWPCSWNCRCGSFLETRAPRSGDLRSESFSLKWPACPWAIHQSSSRLVHRQMSRRWLLGWMSF